MAPVTLALNGGSSSLKFALFEGERDVLRGLVEDVGDSPAVSIGASRLGQPDPPHLRAARTTVCSTRCWPG